MSGKKAMQDRASKLARGKALRGAVSRQSHSQLEQRDSTRAVAILAEGDKGRVPALIPERYKRMLQSPFAFLRGAAAVMAQDLAAVPKIGLTVQAGGDSHLMNFGAFATPEDNILFDVNDFDETLAGVDFVVDLKRLAASVAVAALDAKSSDAHARDLAAGTVRAYRREMSDLSALSPLEIWHSRIDLEDELAHFENRDLKRKLETTIKRARGEGLAKDDNFPHLVGNGLTIADKCPTIYHLDRKQDQDAKGLFTIYRQQMSPERRLLIERYGMQDLAFKAVGVGSVGTFCCVALFLTGDKEPLFLQVKQAQRSVLERLDAGLAYKGNQGQRVVEGQRVMQAASDIFLGATHDKGRDFYVRTLKNRRLGGVSEITEARALTDYSRLCGKTLARAHARSGEPAAIAGYMGKSDVLDQAIADFAMAYAERTRADYEALVKARMGLKPAKPLKAKRKGKPSSSQNS